MGKNNTNKLFNKLPSYSPNDEAWRNIENTLNTIDKSNPKKTTINKLPEYKAPEDSWSTIESELVKRRKIHNRFALIKMAASIIILISLGFYLSYIFTNKPNYKITYDVEVTGDSTGNTNEQLLTANSDFVEILDENCNVMPEVCDGKKYIELKNQLESLESEEEYLNEQFALYKDEQIASYLKKIASEKLRIEKFMLNMFTSN